MNYRTTPVKYYLLYEEDVGRLCVIKDDIQKRFHLNNMVVSYPTDATLSTIEFLRQNHWFDSYKINTATGILHHNLSMSFIAVADNNPSPFMLLEPGVAVNKAKSIPETVTYKLLDVGKGVMFLTFTNPCPSLSFISTA